MSFLEKGGEPLAVEGLTYSRTAESLAIAGLFVKPTTTFGGPPPLLRADIFDSINLRRYLPLR